VGANESTGTIKALKDYGVRTELRGSCETAHAAAED
jgi:hypothetical protein